MSNLYERIANLSPEKRQLLLQKLNYKKEEVFSRTQIKPLPRDNNYFPLSFAQQRLWFLDQLHPGNIAYNISQPWLLKGLLNVAVLEQSFNEVVKRHEILRTTFTTVDGQPFQVIAPALNFVLPVVDLQQLPPEKKEVEVLRLAAEETQQPFDLSKSPLMRVTLLKLAENEYALLLTIHHIVFDGWSINILMHEITTLYEAFSRGKPSPLAKLPIQYADFAVWQRQLLQGEVMATQISYWKKQLGGKLPVLELPTDYPRLASHIRSGARQSTLPKALSQKLKALNQQEGITLFMTLLAAFQTLLYRYTGQEDIIVGADIANRNQAEVQGLIGFFINLLVLRTDLSGYPSFRELLKRVQKVALEAYAHQDLPFEKLVEELQPERHLNHTPLFQVLFVMENAPKQKFELLQKPEASEFTITPLKVKDTTTKFDLALFVSETDQGIDCNWNYNATLFNANAIARMSEHFEVLLNSIVTQPDARINTLDMSTAAEKQQQIITQAKQEESKFKKFIQVKPKVVKLSQVELIKTGYLEPGQALPLLIKPNIEDADLIDWAKGNQQFITTQLHHHGGILFRGFNLNSVSEFENLAQAICPELFSDYGDLPREGVSGKVYSSTPYPPDQAILFHNESSHLHRWPMKIWFFCLQPAKLGGETPIVDCRKVYQLLDLKLRARFEQKQLMYVRNYIEGLDVSWQDFFRTTDKTVVEDYCSQAGINFEWLSGNGLVTRKIRPAISQHPKTGESVFFNQVQLHHISCLEASVRESLLLAFGKEKLPRNVYYGDGSPIEDSVMAEIGAVYQQAKISFSWQQGDVLMLDNMLTAHGRNPYQGSRKIVVAMGEMVKQAG